MQRPSVAQRLAQIRSTYQNPDEKVFTDILPTPLPTPKTTPKVISEYWLLRDNGEEPAELVMTFTDFYNSNFTVRWRDYLLFAMEDQKGLTLWSHDLIHGGSHKLVSYGPGRYGFPMRFEFVENKVYFVIGDYLTIPTVFGMDYPPVQPADVVSHAGERFIKVNDTYWVMYKIFAEGGGREDNYYYFDPATDAVSPFYSTHGNTYEGEWVKGFDLYSRLIVTELAEGEIVKVKAIPLANPEAIEILLESDQIPQGFTDINLVTNQSEIVLAKYQDTKEFVVYDIVTDEIFTPEEKPEVFGFLPNSQEEEEISLTLKEKLESMNLPEDYYIEQWHERE